LLWEVVNGTGRPNYIFGTIHVGDEAVVNLPQPVSTALIGSEQFIMEVLPDPDQAAAFASMMFFGDGRSLKKMLPEEIYRRAVGILGAYHLPEAAVSAMKPWAAFVTMSYPADMRTVLDLELLGQARDNGAEIHGLETLEEQGMVFNDMALEDQIRLLIDATCYYEQATDDFEIIKALYLQRDLKELYLFGQRYEFEDNSVYERLTRRLLADRNHLMVRRMMPALARGSAFVAIGAMHLVGSEGVLALLEKHDYSVSRIY